MTCRRTVNPRMLLPKRRVKVVPIGAVDILLYNQTPEQFFKPRESWWKKLLRLQK